MPGGEDGHGGETARVPRAGLFVEPQPEEFRHRARFRSVVERHHEDADKNHGGNGADPVEVAGDDAILCAGSAHADDFLGAEVSRDESQTADPGGQRAPGLEEVLAGFHEAFECEANAQHKNEVQQHDEPVDGGQVHALLSSMEDWMPSPQATVHGCMGQVQMTNNPLIRSESI